MADRPTRLPGVFTRPMSWLYGLGAAHKARRFDAGRGVVQLDRPVISVGNLSAGGTGKSPMVHHIVRTLLDNGHCPAIAMRGYKAAPGTLGDEGMEHRVVFPEVPIIAQPDRITGLRALFATDAGSRVDCVVLDDGFQHRRIARDLDLVLIDASRPPDRDALLPHGFLRESVSALKRADAFVLTHAELVDGSERKRISQWIETETNGSPIAHTRHEWSALEIYEGRAARSEPPGWIKGRRVVLACGIGNPEGLIRGVEAHGGQIEQQLVLGDHRAIDPEHLGTITAQAGSPGSCVLLMTRKDWVKLGTIDQRIACPIVIPRLVLAFDEGSERLDSSVLQAVRGGSPGA